MEFVLLIPLPLRLLGLFLLGTLVGGQVNRGIYRLAWYPRLIGPWSPAHPAIPPRVWSDRLPILGWWGMQRESDVHGRFFWLRPLLIELGLGLGFAWLYWFEVDQAAIVNQLTEAHPGLRGFVPSVDALHAQYLTHIILISLMMVATFIDFDEQTIPDAITVLGAFTGFVLAYALPSSRQFVSVAVANGLDIEHLHLASGNSARVARGPTWPAWLDGFEGLLCGLVAFFAWWVATLPWTWTTRKGYFKAWSFFFASIVRRMTWLPVLMASVGSILILISWQFGGDRWDSLFSSLVGAVFGGALVWAVRLVGSLALGQEAMGFGDVTLMAMIGAFLGWQATLIVLGLAPVAALVISVANWLLTRRKDIAFGPYLCLGALVLILAWGLIWERYAARMFDLGVLLPIMLAASIPVMWALLVLMRVITRGLEAEVDEPESAATSAGSDASSSEEEEAFETGPVEPEAADEPE